MSTPLWRQPLLHFILLGGALFLLHHALTPPPAPQDAPHTITLSAERQDALRQDFERRHRRPPTPDELARLIEDAATTEILYREALARGLDLEDPIIRRRLVQKMTLLLEDLAQPTPTDAKLSAFYQTHGERYRSAPTFSFSHIFLTRLDPARLTRVIVALAAGREPAQLGEPFPHGHTFTQRHPGQIDATFGAGFAAQLAPLSLDTWSPLLRSTYGLHLVRITAREPAGIPPLQEVRERVLRDYAEATRKDHLQGRLDTLRQRYTLILEER